MFEEDIQNLSLDSILQKAKSVKAQNAKRVAALASTGARVLPKTEIEPPAAAAAGTVWQKNSPAFLGKPFYLRKKFWMLFVLLVFLGGAVYAGGYIFSFGKKIFDAKNPLSFFASFGKLLTSNDRPVQGESEGQVNILLLGIGGEGHDGALLTDTIILASIKPAPDKSDDELSLLSIPRDFIVKLPEGLDWRKINSAYAYGELKEKGLGARWVTQAVEEWTGLDIPYYALIDFAGFQQAVDDLGGIDITVDRAFTDSFYPDSRHGYLPTLKFEAGQQHMDGEKALQYARSRHGTNGEGSDFARSRRQQKILSAVKEKLSQLKIASNLSTVTKLLGNFSDHFRTNLEPWEIKRIYDLTREMKEGNIFSLALSHETGLVCDEIAEDTGAYVLTLCPGKQRSDIHQFVSNIFKVAPLLKESASIEFQNSTSINFLAQQAQVAIGAYSPETSVANFPDKKTLSITVVHDLTGGAKPHTLEYLTDELQAVASTTYPYLKQLSKPAPDFVVVLGLDAKGRFPPLPPPPQPRVTPTATSTAQKATSTTE